MFLKRSGATGSDRAPDNILDVLADSSPDIPSEGDESVDRGCETVIPSKRWKTVISSDPEPEELNDSTRDVECDLHLGCRDNDWSKEDFGPHVERAEGNSDYLHRLIRRTSLKSPTWVFDDSLV